jgi:hypothetical protein
MELDARELQDPVANASGHDHAAHALRNILTIASFYEGEDDARDALVAINSIVQRGLSHTSA